MKLCADPECEEPNETIWCAYWHQAETVAERSEIENSLRVCLGVPQPTEQESTP